MNFIAKFFHELRNPHCAHCEHEKDKTFELLLQIVEKEKFEKKQLLDYILTKPEKEEPIIRKEEIQPVQRMAIPWKVRQQELEANDRKQMQVLKEREEDIKKHAVPVNAPLSVEELEKELQVEENAN